MSFLLRNVIIRKDLFEQKTFVSVSNSFLKMSKNKKKEQQATASNAIDPLYDSNRAVYLLKNGNKCVNFLAKPGANETCITDINADSIGVRIAAPPVDGEANKELVKYLSRLLKQKSGDVYLDTGAKNRHKTVVIQNSPLGIEQLLEVFKNEI